MRRVRPGIAVISAGALPLALVLVFLAPAGGRTAPRTDTRWEAADGRVVSVAEAALRDTIATRARQPEPFPLPEARERTRRWPAEPAERVPYRSPEAAALRSAVWPGWGQFHLGDSTGGALFTTGALIGLSLGLELVELSSSGNTQQLLRTIGWGLYAFDATLAAVGAYRAAEAINRENGYDLFEDELAVTVRRGPARGERGPRIVVVLWTGRF